LHSVTPIFIPIIAQLWGGRGAAGRGGAAFCPKAFRRIVRLAATLPERAGAAVVFMPAGAGRPAFLRRHRDRLN